MPQNQKTPVQLRNKATKEYLLGLRIIKSLTRALSNPDFNEVEKNLSFVCKKLCDEMQVEIASVFLETDERLIRRQIYPPREDYPEELYKENSSESSLVQAIFKSGQAEYIKNYKSDKRVNQHIAKEYRRILGHDFSDVIVVPIKSNKGTLGVLRLVNKLDKKGRLSTDGFGEAEIEVFGIIAAILGISIESARRIKQVDLIGQLSPDINNIKDEDKLLEKILEIARDFFSGFQSGIVMFTDNNTYGYVAAQYPEINKSFQMLENYPMIALAEYGAIKEINRTFAPLFIQDAQSDKKLTPQVRELMTDQDIASILLIPLISQDHLIGTLNVEWKFKKKENLVDLTQARLFGLLASEAMEKIYFPGKLLQARAEGGKEERQRYSALLHDVKGAQHRVLLDMEDFLQTEKITHLQKEKIIQIYKKARYSHENIRNVMQDLRSNSLTKEGLVGALQEFIKNSSKENQISFLHKNLGREQKIHISIAFNLLCIAREFISNAIKHGVGLGSDGRIEVSLNDDGHLVIISVSDNGPGMNALPNTDSINTLGMTLIEEWAEEIGATVTYTNKSHLGGFQASVMWDRSQGN